jgi:hypothetical protein
LGRRPALTYGESVRSRLDQRPLGKPGSCRRSGRGSVSSGLGVLVASALCTCLETDESCASRDSPEMSSRLTNEPSKMAPGGSSPAP